jgi:hypothetical protein
MPDDSADTILISYERKQWKSSRSAACFEMQE